MTPKKKKMKWKVGDLIYYKDAGYVDYLLIAEVDDMAFKYKIVPIKTERYNSETKMWKTEADSPHYVYDTAINNYKRAV
jgi:hypothetical protein